MNDEKRDEMQQKMVAYQVLKNQMGALEEQEDALNTSAMETQGTLAGLEEISRLAGGEEMLVPLGSGVFIHAFIKDAKSCLVGIGADVICNKTVAEAKEKMLSKLKEIEAQYKRTIDSIRQAVEQMRRIAPEALAEQQARGSDV